ncbi:hypothetical protein, partial [uncultured Roseibium sp.]|uniref:hypothetical protein n=1 Tax=uncultured Roseibium sp. TaxID=1936171 RepID=UPI002592605E
QPKNSRRKQTKSQNPPKRKEIKEKALATGLELDRARQILMSLNFMGSYPHSPGAVTNGISLRSMRRGFLISKTGFDKKYHIEMKTPRRSGKGLRDLMTSCPG